MESRSEFHWVRGLRYHLRVWGDVEAPPLLLLHGWLDVSATFAPLVQSLLPHYQVLAPDWRGLGHTDWAKDGGYWFPDYLADLDALIDQRLPEQSFALVGHSMGAQAASLYAGLRPQRIRELVVLDGLFLPDMEAKLAPKRYAGWLDQQKKPPQQKYYDSFEQLAQRVKVQHPQLSDERALFIARCWGQLDGQGSIRLLADPAHRYRGPSLYRAAESEAIWAQITARSCFIDGEKSMFVKAIDDDTKQQRRQLFPQGYEERVIEGAGHMLHFDAPQATGRAILEFLHASA